MGVRSKYFVVSAVLGLAATMLPGVVGAGEAGKGVDFRKLEFTHGKASSQAALQVPGGSRTLVLHQPEPFNPPSAWSGPVELRNGARPCKADFVVVTDVYAAGSAPYLVLVTFSKNENIVRFMDASTCREAHKPIRAASEAITVSGNRLEIKPACADPARCGNPQVYELFPDASPRLQR